ncbi:hypothetical protein [Caulobacter sp. S45]|uniref:hypothetical protein n=1 Tax=Caulobacter sp. S45 TaxID=1641861 RepID=UPI001576445A|nr:hypothetical protein [Caulobacter sp. S45]
MNPELQRNLWLDATPRKLAFVAAGVAGVFAAVWLLDRGRHPYAVTFAGSMVFFATALAWAPRAARASVTDEVRAGSWDFQRLCALTPWEMTWGKLAGATARSWAGALAGLALAALQLASTSSLRHAGFWVLVALGLAVTLQASGLATGLIDVRRARASGRPLSGRAPGLLLLMLGLFSLAVLVWVRARVGRVLGGLALQASTGTPAAPVWWSGHAFGPLGFAALSLLVLAGWALVWAWRLMRLELQFVNAPWLWAGFLTLAGLYVLGFDPGDAAASPRAARLSAAAHLWAGLAYVAAFAEPADRVRARQFGAALRGRQAGRMLSHLPIPALPSLLALVGGLLVAILYVRGGDPGAAAAVLATLAFFARDLGVIAWRRFAGRGRQADAGVLVLLLALYLAGAGLGRVFGGLHGQALFWPSRTLPGVSLVAGTVEAAVAWLLAGAAIARPAAPRRAPWPGVAAAPDPEPSPASAPSWERRPEPPAADIPVKEQLDRLDP